MIDPARHPHAAIREAVDALTRRADEFDLRQQVAVRALHRVRSELVSGGEPQVTVQTVTRIVGETLAVLDQREETR